ncbi:hypothetical protein LY78DRAFT_59825 [Colletotrichum sublineola]|nr:hypothetical protein LY78DRAFT_59825 [Colletotrichum sublineola]
MFLFLFPRRHMQCGRQGPRPVGGPEPLVSKAEKGAKAGSWRGGKKKRLTRTAGRQVISATARHTPEQGRGGRRFCDPISLPHAPCNDPQLNR